MSELFREFVLFFKDFQAFWLFFLIVVTVVFVWINFRRGKPKAIKSKDDLERLGKLIWVDESSDTKPFFNQEFKVYGKPDAMYSDGEYISTVEYKSRKSGVKKSDVIQALTAALAARGDGYNVHKVVVVTEGDAKQIEVPKSLAKHYQLVKEYVELARSIKIDALNNS